MYLNLDVFEERDVELQPEDWTWEQFVDTAKQLTFTRANGDKVYGYSGGIDPGLVNTWPFILGDGAMPISADNTKYTWNTADGYSGLKKLVGASDEDFDLEYIPTFRIINIGFAF